MILKKKTILIVQINLVYIRKGFNSNNKISLYIYIYMITSRMFVMEPIQWNSLLSILFDIVGLNWKTTPTLYKIPIQNIIEKSKQLYPIQAINFKITQLSFQQK